MRNRLKNDNRMLEYDIMRPYSNISCFSTTRHGGCGVGTYGTFNCTHYCGDSPGNVAENLERLETALPEGIHAFIIPRQTHGVNVKNITNIPSQEELEDVDAVVTGLKGLCLCVSTADCVPILLYDRKREVIAAIHAGWRGTVVRIVEKTLHVMKLHYNTEGKNVIACIGPSISLESFEVGDEVYAAFAEANFEMELIARRYEKWHIDLWEANRMQLLKHGVLPEHIEVAGICTYLQHEDFFSARRLGVKSGRILTGIVRY